MTPFACKHGCAHGGITRDWCAVWSKEPSDFLMGSYKPLSPAPWLLVVARVPGSGESGPRGATGTR